MPVNKELRKTNPNGANQWVADPRQQLFLAYYKDPKSTTFSNARQSAIRAGFSGEYADNILALQPEWLSEAIGGTSPLLALAEKNLKEFLELPNETPAMGAFGPVLEKVKVQDGTFKNGKPKFKTVKKPVMALNAKIMKIKQDTSHFIAERIGKKKYGNRAGEGGTAVNILVLNNEQRTRVAKRVIVGGGSAGSESGERSSD